MPHQQLTKCVVGLFVAATLCGSTSQESETVYYSGPITDHFDGERFFNPDGNQGTGGTKSAGINHFIAVALGTNRKHTWPHHVPVKVAIPEARIFGDDMRVTWIGHATALIQTQGLNILTDPVWAERDSPSQILGPRRVRMPGIKLADLPPIDLILLSHNHYDHLDIAAMKSIAGRDKPLIVTGLGNEKLLAKSGVKAVGRDWGQRVALKPGIEVILRRAHHWSAHGLKDHDRTLWAGFTVTLPTGDIYYAGDTGPGDMLWASEARSDRPIRLAILPIGPYAPDGPQTGNHIGPSDAVRAFQQVGATYALGVHWGTFELSAEPIDGPPKMLAQSLADQGLSNSRFRVLEAGGSWDIPTLVSDP